MRPIYRMTLAAVVLAAIGATAQAQQQNPPPGATNLRDWFSNNPGQSLNSNIGPNTAPPGFAVKPAHRVRPVPEPSQWALMATGVGLVAWIVRRRSKRNKD